MLHEVRAEVVRLSLAEYRALPARDRPAHWFASWNPFRGERVGRAWQVVLDRLGDGHWHRYQIVRAEMVEAGPISWRASYRLLYSAVRAGALDELRPGGSRHFVDRSIRLRPDIPTRLLRPPEDVKLQHTEMPDSYSDSGPEMAFRSP